MKLHDLVGYDVSGHPLIDFVDGWAAHLMQISDLTRSDDVDNPYGWGPHDFIGALHTRSIVQRGMIALGLDPEADESAIPRTVACLDRAFTAITRPDLTGALRLVDPDVPDSPWWWSRLPARGPILREIEQIVARSRPPVDE